MHNIEVLGLEFQYEFRHDRTHPRLRADAGCGGMTTCVVRGHDDQSREFCAIETVICAPEDNFSRSSGRLRAMFKVLCCSEPLRHVRLSFWLKFQRIQRVPVADITYFDPNKRFEDLKKNYVKTALRQNSDNHDLVLTREFHYQGAD